jgi:hypothetical protein
VALLRYQQLGGCACHSGLGKQRQLGLTGEVTVAGGKFVNAKKIMVVSVLCAAVALVACRREERYVPLKLGADINVQQQQAAR